MVSFRPHRRDRSWPDRQGSPDSDTSSRPAAHAATSSPGAPGASVPAAATAGADLEVTRLDPPLDPQVFPGADTLGQAMWTALYGHLDPASRPPAVALLVEGDAGSQPLHLSVVEHPVMERLASDAAANGASASNQAVMSGARSVVGGARVQELDQPEFQRRIVAPLVRMITQVYQPPLALLLLPHGAVLVADLQEGYARIKAGREIADPRLPRARISPLVYRVWTAMTPFLDRSHPLITGVGAISAILLWGLVVIFGAVWLTAIVPRLVQALQHWPVTADWHPWLHYGIAISINAIEVIGFFLILDRVSMALGGLMALIEAPFHIWYGVQQAHTHAAASADLGWMATSVVLALGTAWAPEFMLAVLLIAAVRLTPLVPALLLELRMLALTIAAIWQRIEARQRMEAARQRDPVHAQTVIYEDGRVETVYVRPVE